jgi:hypothetical protein
MAGPVESRSFIEETLNAQLVGLGLGSLVNASPQAGPRRNKKKLLHRLQQAELRKRHEEQVLQHTIALLEQCLRDPPAATVSEELHSQGMSQRSSHRVAPGRNSARSSQHWNHPESSESSASYARWVVQASDESQEETMMPVLSHREHQRESRHESHRDSHYEKRRESHQLRQTKDRRRETELRFDEASFEPMSMADVPQRRRSKQKSERRHRSISNVSEVSAQGPPLRQRARTDGVPLSPREHQEHLSSISWMLEYDHVKPENLVHPFEPHRALVIHSPVQKMRRQLSNEPLPPVQLYGPEPLPPHQVHPAGRVKSWRTADGPWRSNLPARTNINTVCLEALAPPPPPRRTRSEYSERARSEYSEASLSSDSVSEVDGWCDGGLSEAGGATDGFTNGRRSLQHKIDKAKAVINKCRMTIDMLQYRCAHGEGGVTATDRFTVGEGYHGYASGDEAAQQWPQPTIPGFAQDCCARLLRKCLEGLGPEKFHAARHIVEQSFEDQHHAGLRKQMLGLLGLEKVGFWSLIDQIVHIERSWAVQELG